MFLNDKVMRLNKLSEKQFNSADWMNEFNDWSKNIGNSISVDYDLIYSYLADAYKYGFEEGYHTAIGTKQDEFGNFIVDEVKK